MRVIDASETGILVLGYQGESQRVMVRLPLVDERNGRNVAEEFPGGQFSLSVTFPNRPGEYIVSPSDYQVAGDWLEWVVKAAYTQFFGEGKLQINYGGFDSTGMTKSRVWRITNKKSISTGAGTVPDWSDWKDELLNAAAAVQNAVDSYDEMTAEAEDGEQTSAHIDRTGDHPVLHIEIKNNGGGGGGADIDDDHTGTDKTWSSKKISDELDTKADEEDLSSLSETIVALNNGGKVLTNGTKTALLNLFSHVAFTDENAQTYINALIDSWTPSGTLTSIDAVFTQTGIVEEGDNLDSLKQYLVVNGTYSYNGSTYTEEISEYTLSGTLAVGTSTITVTVGMLTDSFTVIVSQYNRYETKTKIIASGQQYISTNMSETDLDGCRFEYKLAPGSMSTNASGHLLSTEKNFIPYLKGSAHNSINASRNGGSGFDFEYNWTIGADYTVVYDMADGSVSVNGTALERSVVSGSSEPSNTRKYIMFGYHGAGYEDYFYAGALYYMKIYSSGNVLIHHFVPALDKQTNKVGVYDEVTESFMSSSSSTEFTAE